MSLPPLEYDQVLAFFREMDPDERPCDDGTCPLEVYDETVNHVVTVVGPNNRSPAFAVTYMHMVPHPEWARSFVLAVDADSLGNWKNLTAGEITKILERVVPS